MSPLLAPSFGVGTERSYVITTLSDGWWSPQQQATAQQTWGTANRAIYVPFRLVTPMVVLKLGYQSNFTTGAGNIDVGIYDAAGTRLVSSGSVAKPATSGFVKVDVTDTVVQPGLYFFGLNNSTTTDTFNVSAETAPLPAARGVRVEALGSVTLPATATWGYDQTLAFVPQMCAWGVPEA